MNKFKVGDRVVLAGINDDSVPIMVVTEETTMKARYKCFWFDRNHCLQSGYFSGELLDLQEPL